MQRQGDGKLIKQEVYRKNLTGFRQLSLAGSSEYESEVLFPAIYMNLDRRSSGKQMLKSCCRKPATPFYCSTHQP